MLTLFLLLIFVGCVGALYMEGMWGNALRLVNVVTAALLATNFFEPVAAWLDAWQPTYTFVWDFMAIWGLFVFFMAVFRAATDLLSRVKVRFLTLADRIGSPCFAALVGWVMVCFTLTSLHTAPLPRNFLGGAFNPEKRMFFGTAPDRQWLGFVQMVSGGSFSRGLARDEAAKQAYGVREGDTEAQRQLAVFDRNADFMVKYASRRARLEAHMAKPTTRSIRVQPGAMP